MSYPNVSVFGVSVSTRNIDQTVDYLFYASKVSKIPIVREDLNAFKVCLKLDDNEVSSALNHAHLVNADGMSIVFAIKFLAHKKIPRVSGCDLFVRLLSECHSRKKTIFLLGANEEVLSNLCVLLSKKYSPQLIAGKRNGYFTPEHWDEIISEIHSSNADFVFVGTPSPQKESFLNYAKERINAGTVLMGVGGSFDVVAGKVKRAPLWMQKYGLEWLYRVIQEPGRMWKRYLTTNSKFAWLLLKEKFAQLTSKNTGR